MAEPIAALVVRILTDTSEMVTGVKKATDQLDGFENHVIDVDKALAEISGSSARAGGSVGELTGSYRQFDGVLQAVGINIGPQAKGIEDIAAAAGKSASSVGALGTAGLVLGAGMAGWQVGRAIADFFQLDDAIAQASAELMGYGNLAGEIAGAKQDVVNRAIAAGAKETITYAQAVQFLIQQKQAENTAYAVSAERLAATQKEVRGLSEAKIAAIDIAIRNGASVQQMTGHFNVSADALRLLAEKQRDAAKAAGEHTKEAEALQKSYEKLISEMKNANQMAIFDKDADTERRRQQNEQQLGLMDRDARLGGDRRAFDEAEAAASAILEWERRFLAEQAQIDREFRALVGAAPSGVVVNPGAMPSPSSAQMGGGGFGAPTNINITAQGLWDSPDRIQQLARAVEDAIAQRSGLSRTYTRR